MGIVAIRVYFSGKVQGVGFRYQTLQVAKGYDVRGRVKNLPDGRVEMEAEGEKEELEAFLDGIKTEMNGYIKDVEITPLEKLEKCEGFRIDY